MVLVFSIFQSHRYHKLLPQHLSSAMKPPIAPQATHGKRHLCANVGDLILLKAQHLQGPVVAQSLCKRLRKRNLGNSSASISACDNVCVCQTKPIVNIPVKHNREITSDTLCYLRTLRPIILLLPLLQDKWMRCRSSCIAMQRTIWRNGATSTSTLRSFEPTPSRNIKPGLRRQKCRCRPSRCSSRSSPDCHSSTVGRPPGFAQKTSPNLTKTPIIQSPNTSPLTCHDHLPFVGKRMHRDAQRSSRDASMSTSLSAWKTATRPWPLRRRSDLQGQQRWRWSPGSSSPRRQPPPAAAWRGRARIKAGWVGWVGWSPVGPAVATCWSPLGNVAAGLETNRCVERQPVLDGPVPPQGFCQGLAAEVTQAAFATLQKVELKKNLTVRICEDLWRSVKELLYKGNAIKCAARYSLYWTLSETGEIAWAKPSWLQHRI